MWPDQVLNPGPLTYESGALPTVLRTPAVWLRQSHLREETFNPIALS